MPLAAPRPCTYPGCGALVRDGSGRCDRHRQQLQREQDARRGSAAKRGYGWRWRNYRVRFLREHALCECPECDAGRKRVTPAEVVDHIIPHRGDERLFWDPKNHQALSKRCHDRKTAREDGGFGHARAGVGLGVQKL